MSGGQDPQGIRALPRREPPKRLGKVPLIIGGVAALGAAGALGVVLLDVIHAREAAGSTPPGDVTSGDPGDALSAGSGYAQADTPAVQLAAANMGHAAEETRHASQQTAAQPPQQQPDVHAQARLQAWQSYYQQRAQLIEDRRRRAVEAMQANPGEQAAQGQPQQGEQQAPQPVAQAGADAAAGGVPGQQPQAPAMPRPGQLYQGPVSAGDLYLATAPLPAQSRYELKGGVTVIPYRLLQNITTGAAGQFVAMVTKHVTDYATGDNILIPQGAFIRGVYEDRTSSADERMKVAITSVTFPRTHNPRCPGGEEMPLGSMPGADGMGEAGYHDIANHHYLRTVFNAFLLALGGAGTQLAQPNGAGFNGATIAAGQAGIAGQYILNNTVANDLSRGVTFETRAGYPAVLQLTKTIPFDQPWIPGRGFCGANPNPQGVVQ
jgi:type IV secretion system protein VirB10